MSKFLKFIVSLILIVFIAAGAALIVPQFVGDLDTVVVQQGMVSNKSVGTVIYAKKEAVEDLQVGDQVIDMDADSLYVHEVISYDHGTQTAQVMGSTPTAVRIGDAYSRAVLSVPLIGYLTIATQSMPGLILLGLLLGLVILLFVASEILRRGADDDSYDSDVFEKALHEEENDDNFYGEIAEKKRQTEQLPQLSDELPTPVPPTGLFPEETVAGAEEKATEVGEDAGDFFEDAAEEAADLKEAEAEAKETVGGAAEEIAEAAADEADAPAEDGMLELSKEAPREEEVPAGKEEVPLGTGELPDVQAALEAALENQQLNRSERPRTPTTPLAQEAEDVAVPNEDGEIELAMPVHTAEEILSKATADCMDPKVREENGVTLVDFSECL